MPGLDAFPKMSLVIYLTEAGVLEIRHMATGAALAGAATHHAKTLKAPMWVHESCGKWVVHQRLRPDVTRLLKAFPTQDAAVMFMIHKGKP